MDPQSGIHDPVAISMVVPLSVDRRRIRRRSGGNAPDSFHIARIPGMAKSPFSAPKMRSADDHPQTSRHQASDRSANTWMPMRDAGNRQPDIPGDGARSVPIP
ncbi:MAG: hypothetical protein M0Z37_07555 [Nitrospiraceae bacterium]|nr:hypothetical protein [Nitrospiraceae bacterium]